MTFFRYICVTFCLLWSLAPATSHGEPASTIVADESLACVWKVKGSQNTVYIAGSVHLLRQKDYPLPAAYDIAYNDSAHLYFEIDMLEINSPETIKKCNDLVLTIPGIPCVAT